MTRARLHTGSRTRAIALLAGVAIALALLAAGAGYARAEACAGCKPHWHITIASEPTNLAPGSEGRLIVTATNLGDAPAAGATSTITLSDTLPHGLTLTQPHMLLCKKVSPPESSVCGQLAPGAKPLACSTTTISCEVTQNMRPYEQIELEVGVKVEEPAGTVTTLSDTARVEGGASEAATLSRPLRVSSEPSAFGIDSYEIKPELEDGLTDTSGGSHPFQLTTTVIPNTGFAEYEVGRTAITPELLKNLQITLPAGLVGDPNGVPECSEALFTTHPQGQTNLCPADSAIGVAVVRVFEPVLLHEQALDEPVFNLEPAEGEPARFGFQAANVPVILDTALAGGDHHVVVTTRDTSEAAAILAAEVTIWGSPSDARHDESRGFGCLEPGAPHCQPLAERSGRAFLTLPTACEGPLQTSLRAQSWTAGAPLLEPLAPAFTAEAPGPPALAGGTCASLPFAPSLSVEPDEHTSNTPTGLTVNLEVPQGPTLDPAEPAEADLRDQTVTLPLGVQLNPAAAGGLSSCSEAQIGFMPGAVDSTGQLEFTSAAPECPDGSKLGTVEVRTPLLGHVLHGAAYLAAQNENPFGERFGIYLVIDDPASGVLIKLAGRVQVDPGTGQITTTFSGAPQLPFEDLRLHFFNGPRAAVATPRECSTTAYTTSAAYTPWSSEKEHPITLTATLPGEQFAITAGPGGSPCASPLPFAPGVQGGSANPQAGAFTSFALSISRPEADQAIATTSVSLPPGLAAMVSKVQQCPEAQANAGTCPQASLIGSATAIVGLGEDPFTEGGGQVFFTGGYEGAPFGLSIVIPAVAGPFDFGHVVTRAAIRVDPTTAAITITSRLPTMLNTTSEDTGVPVQLRRVDIDVARPGGAPFQFNPTDCGAQQITTTLVGEQGATSTAQTPFRVSGCEHLPFTPGLSAESSAHVSRVTGTSLKVLVTSGEGQSNIAKTKLQFPAQLPSRLSTLHGACLEAVFDANPAGCSPVSIIGTAVALTPVLSSPLTGPVYLVSHGNAAFPDAEIVLQGEGVTLILDGLTNIHNGITSSTFDAVPDAPVSSFEVNLPAGPHSAFTGYGNLCPTSTVTQIVHVTKRVHGRRVRTTKKVQKLVIAPLSMPTFLTAHNGDVIERITPIKVAGCTVPKAKVKTKTKAKARAKKGSAGRG
jgi:uncharacterized repeat protein (TIGR01451 family)